MASFTQQSPITFSDYHPAFNSELYTQIGMTKQGQYDRGVATDQAAFDHIAGLPIAKEEDKQYLQNLLTSATTQANAMGGADFSDQRIVGQLQNLAAGVGNDQNVQTAVSSTASYRAFVASQKTLQEKHPELYTQAWKAHQSEPAMQWLSDGKAGSAYHGPTTASAYTNYRDELTEQLKGIDPTVTTEISPDGQFQYKTEKKSEVTDERIRGIITSYFASNPNASESMLADAKYTYGNDPHQIASSIVNYSDSTLKQLQAQNEGYLELIKNHPGNVDYVTDLQRKIKDNIATGKELAGKRDGWLSQLSDPANLTKVKFDVFSHNFSNGLVLRYKQDSLERDLKENYEAVHQQAQKNSDRTFGMEAEQHKLSWLTNGLDPDTHQPLDPNSPYYAWFITTQMTSKTGKGKDGAKAADGSDLFSDNALNVAETNKNGEFTTEELNKQKQELMAKIGQGTDGTIVPNSLMDRLRQNFYDHAGAADANFNNLPPQQKQAQFDQFYKTQSANFVNGETTAPYFKEFRQATYADQVKLSNLEALNKEAMGQAAIQHPISSIQPVLIKGLKIGNENRNFYVDFQNSPQFIGDITRMYHDLQKTGEEFAKKNGLAGTLDNNITYPGAYEAKQATLNKYRNLPHFDQMKALMEQKPSEAYSKIIAPVENVASQRNTTADDYLKEHGKGFNTQMSVYDAKKTDLDGVKRRIFTAMKESAGDGGDAVMADGSKYSISKHGIDDIEPIGRYRTNDGKVYERFQIGKNAPVDLLIPGMKDDAPNPDPYDWLVKTIAINKKTPASGEGALSTYDGKVRFQIKEGMLPGNYDVAIINKGIPTTVELHQKFGDDSSPLMKFNHPGQIHTAIEKLQQQVNQVYGIKSNSEDMLYLLTHSGQEATAYIKNKYGK